jgi:hypothetical protein
MRNGPRGAGEPGGLVATDGPGFAVVMAGTASSETTIHDAIRTCRETPGFRAAQDTRRA